MHVMAAVLRDAHGRVLLAQRPAGKHLAGMWEFPGGKLEPGESPQAALARELHEELGIRIDPADGRPLIRVPWRYAERGLLLDAWQFDRWNDTPMSLEGQALRWMQAGAIDPAELAPADRPILQALRLPPIYAITPADIAADDASLWQKKILRAFQHGVRLVQLRMPHWSLQAVREFAAVLQSGAVDCGAQVLLNGDIEGARALGAGVGVHLRAAQLDALQGRPLPWTQPVGSSCHSAAELARAVEIDADFATLSPVAPTGSHPHAAPLGWPRFQELAEAAALPVYALGGVTPAEATLARAHAGLGAAGIGAFWQCA